MLEPVAPVKPVSPYVGGKRNLARLIVPLIGSIPHSTYAEVFVGMGGIFLRRNLRPKVEIINDWSQDVSTFFRVLQRHYVAFLDMLRFQVTSRAGFELLLATSPDTLTDLERSARFLYLQRLAFGGKVSKRSFGVSPNNPGRFNLTTLTPMLEDLHERLSGVTIERLHYREFIARYDRPFTLFYLDPPYLGSERDYGDGLFSRDDFEALAGQLGSIQGKFVLSLNDHPDVRHLFRHFQITEVPTTYHVGGGDKAKHVTELVISNAI